MNERTNVRVFGMTMQFPFVLLLLLLLVACTTTPLEVIDFDDLPVSATPPPGQTIPFIQLALDYRRDCVFRRMNSRMTGWPFIQLPVVDIAESERLMPDKFNARRMSTTPPNCIVTLGEHLWLTMPGLDRRLVAWEMTAVEHETQQMFIAYYAKRVHLKTELVTLRNYTYTEMFVSCNNGTTIDEVIIGCTNPSFTHCGMVTYDTFLFDRSLY